MCWSAGASIAVAAAGTVATGLALRRGEPAAVSLALGYFTVMEGLQAIGYAVIDDCGSRTNQGVTLLSYLHIVFQPFVINAFILSLLPASVRQRLARPVYAICALSAAVMLVQLAPFPGVPPCTPGTVMCGPQMCLISGTWHIGWMVPYTALLEPVEALVGTRYGFPTYVVATFLVPLLYGAWRFVLFHAAVGPYLARALSDHPNEWPAVWCLLSIGILLLALFPRLRGAFAVRDWPLWPRGWRMRGA